MRQQIAYATLFIVLTRIARLMESADQERRASCVLCDFDLCMECAGGDAALLTRQPGFDAVFAYNDLVYAANVWIGGVRMAGLVARRRIHAGSILGEYEGAVLSRRRAEKSDMRYNHTST